MATLISRGDMIQRGQILPMTRDKEIGITMLPGITTL